MGSSPKYKTRSAQVTRLKCGGFILALRFNHTMSDAAGMSFFLKTLAEFARGARAPSVPPAWDRHLLTARVPARVTHAHREYDESAAAAAAAAADGHMVSLSFFFGHAEISAVRQLFPTDLQKRPTDFETLVSFLWRCRTAALRPDPNAEMRLLFTVDMRPRIRTPPLPMGYYGNAVAMPAAIATARNLTERPLEFALRLVREAKSSLSEEYIKSVADLMATRNRPHFTTVGTFIVSDLTRAGLEYIDFGWGTPLYGGVATAGITTIPEASFCGPCKNKKGESGIVVPICLPEPAMERFVKEVGALLRNQGGGKPKSIMSSL